VLDHKLALHSDALLQCSEFAFFINKISVNDNLTSNEMIDAFCAKEKILF